MTLGTSLFAAGLSFHLISPRVRAGERTTLELRLPVPPSQLSIKADASEPPPPLYDDLLTNDTHLKVLAHDAHREGNEYVWRYDLTSYQPGKYAVPPLEVTVGAESYSTESVPLEVTTGRAVGDESLRPEFGTLGLPWRWKLILEVTLLLAALFAAWRAFEKYVRPRLKKLKVSLPRPAPPPPPTESPDAWLKRRLAELRAAFERTDRPAGQLIDELTLTVREYLERRTRQPVTAWTTRDIERHLGRETAEIETLGRCDTFKFRPTKPDAAELFRASLEEAERRLVV